VKYKNQNQGFTLIEILVSLSLLSIVFLLLFSSLYTANKSWSAGEKKISSNDETRVIALFLRRQISQALPITWVHEGEGHLLFKGTENTLVFTTSLPAHRGGGGLNLITLSVVQLEDTSNLIIKNQLLSSELSSYEVNENNTTTLVSNIDNIEISYFGSDEVNQPEDWHYDWIDKKSMPKLIRIEINSSNSGNILPQIDIPIHVDYVKGQPQFTINSEEEAPLS
jgi:general secretion pathway protein J